jgi:beta-lactamase superfamily II metal-dependent hydrolase
MRIEALNAEEGDCLIIEIGQGDQFQRWLIDGGPRGTYKRTLEPRLKEIGRGKPVAFDLCMVTHIDNDHICGMLDLANALVAAANKVDKGPADLSKAVFWYNAFDMLIGEQASPHDPGLAAPAAVAEMLSLTVTDDDAAAVVQAVPQGNALRVALDQLGIARNAGFADGLVMAPTATRTLSGAKVTVLAPDKTAVEALRKEWAKALRKKDKRARQEALQDLFLPSGKLDKTATNLSSIALLVEADGKTMLLTGDARGDLVVAGYKAAKKIPAAQKTVLKLDLLKMPHHGSDRNVTGDFLETFIADHYVFSANGRDDNPSGSVVEAVIALHGQRPITLWFTNRDIIWKVPYKTDRSKKTCNTLVELVQQLHGDYQTAAKFQFRDPATLGMEIIL